MAKRKNYHKKSNKCPEPFNTLIDIAGAITLDYAYSKLRQKNGGKKKKIDPYAATGIAMGMGKLNNTEDLIRFGGILGALGAFDDDDDDNNYIGTSNYHLGSTYKPLNNQYAWRLNCDDGSDYGIYPEDYETRAEYNEALEEAIELQEEPLYNTDFDSDEDVMLDEEDFIDDIEFEFDINDIVTVCRVSLLNTGENNYYFTQDDTVNIGDKVIVKGSEQIGIVLTVEKYTCASLPTEKSPLDEIIK